MGIPDPNKLNVGQTLCLRGKVGHVDDAEFYFTVISAAALPGNSFWLSVVYVNRLRYLF